MKFNKFRTILFLWIGMVLPLLSFGNDQANALFEKGNAFYAKNQYKEALDVYHKILAEDENSSAVYFNMGNASYKLGDIPSALLYYEKAHKLSPNDQDINLNIRLANSKTSDKIEEVPEFFLNRWFNSLVLSLSANTFAILSVVFILLASGLLILYFFAEAVLLKKVSFYSAIILFIFGLLTVFITSKQVSYFENNKQAIVFNNPVTVRSSPAEQSTSLFVIHEGAKVNILTGTNGWVKIKLANGNQGWMKIADLKEI